MKTLGIVLLVLLAAFFGGCTLAAIVFGTNPGLGGLWLVALIAAGLCIACIMAIRALNAGDAPPPAYTHAAPPPTDQDPKLWK